uniref:T9SS type A sorting domain-containing protein n=1 Tax=candidate division WOR-3 bacterium TaxID=2052148 RepID=A0A7V3RIN4_UNCW3
MIVDTEISFFDKITGSFATAGQIYVYQYEYEEEPTEFASGLMAQEGRPLNSGAITIFPNPFKDKLDIRFQIPDNNIRLKIYDACGRLVRRFNHLSATQYGGNSPSNQIVWDGKDESNRIVSPGVYFITIENPATKETSCHKVIKVE